MRSCGVCSDVLLSILADLRGIDVQGLSYLGARNGLRLSRDLGRTTRAVGLDLFEDYFGAVVGREYAGGRGSTS